MDFQIVNQLYESRMFTTKYSYGRYTAEDIAEMTYLYFLSLIILKNEFKTSNFSINYMYETFRYTDINRICLQSTDLHQMLFSLQSRNKDWFKDPKNSGVELKKIKINLPDLLSWAIRVIKVRTNQGIDRRFLIALEKQLNIGSSEYKNIRILVGEWESLTKEQQQLATTRLLYAFRKKLPLSDLYEKMEFIAKIKNLSITGIKNPEKIKKTTASMVKKRLHEGDSPSTTTTSSISTTIEPLFTITRKTGNRRKKDKE